MIFPDKLSPSGQPEQYATGKVTDRFVLITESLKEFDAVRASLANLALIALQSESAMDPEDARILIDFMQIDQYSKGRLTVHSEQAERLADLIRRGGSSVMPEILRNQFGKREDNEAYQMSDEEMTRYAIGVADATNEEVDARKFRKELTDMSLDDIFGSTDEA